MSGLLSLMRLVSPGLPVGAYSYSRGLEQAIELGFVTDAASAERWIAGVIGRGAARTDAPAIVHMHAAFVRGDDAEVERWATTLLALRETAELLSEERNMGEALAKLLIDLGHVRAEPWRRHPARSFSVLFALAAVEWQIAVNDALHGYLWSVCEGQVSAAVRLIPLGQTAGQRMIGGLCERVPGWVATASELDIDNVGGFLPGLALASTLHEEQYARLFRS